MSRVTRGSCSRETRTCAHGYGFPWVWVRVELELPMGYLCHALGTQDHRTKSVLAGFASLGGLWTLVDMFFRLLFGSFLVQILFGGPYA
jgi:hypothetical protein